jgi:hypothetical protein
VIDVDLALRDLPHFEAFPTVAELHALAERLDRDSRFDVTVAGSSVNGLPIHHVRFGAGNTKALLVAGPQAMEPVGGLTVTGLTTLFEHGNSALTDADVEWHVVPCIDPDAALLNEGWYTQPYSVESYLRHFYMQPRPAQVDFSFPIEHKGMVFDRISHEARVLKDVFDTVRPDFYFTLHNYALPTGGTWFGFSRDVAEPTYARIGALTEDLGISIQANTPPGLEQYAPGMRHLPTMKRTYDYLERLGLPIPSGLLGKVGAGSHEYLLEVAPDALVFVVEVPHGQHPDDTSDRTTGLNLRQLKLRIDADNKYLATVILEEWENTHDDLDRASPFYRKIRDELVEHRETLHEGVSEWYMRSIQETLFNPELARTATEADRVDAFMLPRTLFLCNAYTFVRLLREATPTTPVLHAIERLERIFDDAITDIDENIGLDRLRVTDCDTLAKVQLGAGLIALDSLLEEAS